MMNGDIFNDGGTPKYSTAAAIQDALYDLVQTEEMGILADLGADVSWENQGYYYFDKGNALKDRFNEMSDGGNRMWLIDLAIAKMDQLEIHDTIYEALCDPDLAKFLGFKKMFVDTMLNGDKSEYARLAEEYVDTLAEENRFDFQTMVAAWNRAMERNGTPLHYTTTYPSLSTAVINKLYRLDLTEAAELVTECRAHLTAYDDFIFGLRANQALHEEQERMYEIRVRELKAGFDEKLRLVMLAAERVGLLGAITQELGELGMGAEFLALAEKGATGGDLREEREEVSA